MKRKLGFLVNRNHEGDGSPFMPKPGQYERRTATPKTEFWMVLMQMMAIAAIGEMAIAVLLACAFVIGYNAVPLALASLGVVAGIVAWKRRYTDVFLSVLLGSILAMGGFAIGRIVAPAIYLAVLRKPELLVLPGALPVLGALVTGGWRFWVEIVDPNYPAPRTAIARTRAILPWSKEVDADEPPEPDIVVETEAVDRFVPVTGRNYAGRRRRHMIECPNGRRIDAGMLREMVESADNIGLSWEAWNNGRGWGRADWETAIAALAAMGIVTSPEPLKTTVLLVNPDAALDIIRRQI
jgi:hypothetical protein